jgi:phage major head subunit gpT-like protein
MPEMMSMPAPRNLLAAAPVLAPGDPQDLVAFACEPAWIEATAGTDGKPALPRFTMVAYTGGPMRLAGWRHPVIVDLAGLRIPAQHRPIRLGHDAALGVGHTDSIRIDTGRLIAAGVVSRDTAAAREVVVSSKNGFPWQASIGASVEEHEFVREGQTVHVNGQAFTGPVNVVRRASLGEISFVDLGADGNTSAAITATSRDSGVLPMTTPAPAASTAAPAAVAPAQTTEQPAATTVTASATPTAQPTVHAALPEAVSQLRAAAAAETERIAGVRALTNNHPAIAAKAIAEGWDLVRTELEVLRASRPAAPAVHVRDSELTATVLEAACLLAGRFTAPERVYEERVLVAAERRFRGKLSLQRLIMEAAWANGATVRHFDDDPRAALRAAWGDVQAAGLSSIDLPGILSNVANKFLLAGFASSEATWRTITRIAPVTDFKQITRYRLLGNMTYERVAPGGELKHGKLGEEKFTNQADTYGKLVAIDRRDIINDDLGVITGVPQELGRGAGQSLNDLFWTTFLDHAVFFSAANKNLLTGVDTALTIDGLTKAEVAFNGQVDSSGRPLGIAPAILLVPTALNAIGSALIKATEIRENTANAKYPIFNPHQGKYRLEMSRYLDNPKIAGGSSKAWYLLAEPSDLAAIEVVFLNGQEAPVIETADADFSTLGIQLRGYHDFGVAKQDPRAGVKARGE